MRPAFIALLMLASAIGHARVAWALAGMEGLAVQPALAAGQDYSCVVTREGTARCWGDNEYGRLGDGTATDRHTPVAVSGLSGAVAIARRSGPHVRAPQRRHRALLGVQF